MPESPKFFLPAAETTEQAESMYANLAATCHKAAPPAGQRIYSITFKHDGEEWTATVGEKLSGTKTHITGRGSKMRQTTYPVSDPAMVLAIFPGEPYLVVTSQIAGYVGSKWESIFMAGRPYGVRYFASSEE